MKNAATEGMAALLTKVTGVPVVVDVWNEGIVVYAATSVDLSKVTEWLLARTRMLDPDAHVTRVVDATGHAPESEKFFALVRMSWTKVREVGPGAIAVLQASRLH